MADFTHRRERMVERQIAGRGIRDQRVLAAMREVPRERFVPAHLHSEAYDDGPLPVLAGQTISQPYIVALMIEALALQPGDRVLDVGTGSGYAAAVMSRIAAEVYGIERHAELVSYARERLAALGYDNVRVTQGDGTRGWVAHAPYDAIMVAAAGDTLPEPLQAQLAIGGRLIIPLGGMGRIQTLVRLVRRSESDYSRQTLCDVRFVPLVADDQR